MSYKKAWDIGKEGCNGLVIESLLENYKKKKLNYITLDGTNIDYFMVIYSHTYQEIVKGVEASVLYYFSFYEMENACFFYDIKSVHIFVKRKKKTKTIILRNLSDLFFDSILVCMNKIIIHLKILAFKKRIIEKEKLKKKKSKNDLNSRIHYVKSAVNKNNLYINSIKNVLSSNKNKGEKEYTKRELEKDQEKHSVSFNEVTRTRHNNLPPMRNEQDYRFINSNSIGSDDFCYQCFSDIINKEKKELEKQNAECENLDFDYSTSHTSESNVELELKETNVSIPDSSLSTYKESDIEREKLRKYS